MLLMGIIFSPGLFGQYNDPNCGSLNNHYGPFDYTNGDHRTNKLPIVEQHHLNDEIENLTQKGGYVWDDLDYILRAFPNHHRALYSMARYQLMVKRPPDARYYTAECYFERALRLKADDEKVMQIYGIYLHKKGEHEKALEQYKKAERINPGSPELQYNTGLLYYDMKDYKSAQIYADKAYAGGYPLPGLKRLLAREKAK
jgi:tetratricopeptide (TPR) repeat protein